MLNILSILIGLVALVVVVIGQIPVLGALNWLALPFLAVGAGLGALSSSNGGRNFCLVVMVIAVIRLWLGGGVL